MTHTYFTNPTGAENTQLQEFAPKLTTNDNNSTSTAKDYAILDQHVIADTPNILHFTKQLAPTQHGVTYYTFNHSLEGASLSLPGTDGLKPVLVILLITTILLQQNVVSLELTKLF